MAAIPSTPFPVVNINDSNGELDPQQFVNVLREMKRRPYPTESNNEAEIEGWFKFLVSLADSFIGTFPLPGDIPWERLHEKVLLADAAAELFQTVLTHTMSAFCGPRHFLHLFLSRFLHLCAVMDTWIDEGSAVVEDEVNHAPKPLRDRAFDVIIIILRYLGDNHAGGTDDQPLWGTLKAFLSKSLETVHGLLAPVTPLEYPLSIDLFKDYNIPSGNGNGDSTSASYSIVVETEMFCPTFLSLMLQVFTKTLCPPTLSQWLLSDVIRKTVELIRATFDYGLSSMICTSLPLRLKLTEQAVLAGVEFLKSYPVFSTPLNGLPLRLLQYLRFQVPRVYLHSLDSTLDMIFETSPSYTVTKGHISTVLGMLQGDDFPDTYGAFEKLAVSYVRSHLSVADEDVILAIQAALPTMDLGSRLPSVASALEDRRRSLSDVNIEVDHVDGATASRQKIRTILSDLGGSTEHLHLIELLNAVRYVEQVLRLVGKTFEGPMESTSAASRLNYIQLLSELDDHLVRETPFQKNDGPLPWPHPEVFPWIHVVEMLLDGPQEDVHAEVRNKTYMLLSRAIEHYFWRYHFTGAERMLEALFNGVVDKDRGVRLSAGRALAAFFRGALSNESHWRQDLDAIPAFLSQCLEVEKLPIKETAIITLGTIGRHAQGDLLGQVMGLLITQFGNQNPILKGSSYMQILAIASYRHKSPYALLQPHMDLIAPFVVSRMCIQPGLLQELCRIMIISTFDFVSVTQAQTLPQLFGNCELKVLQKIAKDEGSSVSKLLIKHAAPILAHVFQLQGPGQTNKALNFAVKILREDTKDPSIEAPSVIKSCVVPMLAEIIVVLGDEISENRDRAIAALKKVERALLHSDERSPSNSNLGSFLGMHMLGIISNINDMLHDIKGKTSLAFKRKILRSLGLFITMVGPNIVSIAPQFMATFQTSVGVAELAEATLESWHKFLTTLDRDQLGPHVGPTTAALVSLWSTFSSQSRILALHSLEYLIMDVGKDLGRFLDDIVDLSSVPELSRMHANLMHLRGSWSAKDHLRRILDRCSSDNLLMASQSLRELNVFLRANQEDFVHKLASGDTFDPLIGQTLGVLLSAACRDVDGTAPLKPLAFQCMSVLGAVDPDRCEIGYQDPRVIVLHNFTDEEEAISFALHLIRELLVGAFCSTSDIRYQSHLALSIQDLLKFCGFTPALVTGKPGSIPLKVRRHWDSLPKNVVGVIAPLLGARFTLSNISVPQFQHPVYTHQSTYREWMQLWASHLIDRASGVEARAIFSVFHSVVRHKDVVVAHHLLPHLVLNILVSGNEGDVQAIREELLAVLEDQVNPQSTSPNDKKLLSAQAVFMLFDHLNGWVRKIRQEINMKKLESKRARLTVFATPAEEQLTRVDSILSSIDPNLVARAALQCKAYARALMNFESQIIALKQQSPESQDLPEYYERLHEIYSHLNEPDGMEGVSVLILSPTLEHQIRQHESTGRWTAAQSCWEVRLQESPDNIEYHLGLLRCLRNLGHYDTLRTHVRGVLIQKPEWEADLAGFQVESAWMVGAWNDVASIVERATEQTPPIVMAKILLAMRVQDDAAIVESISQARVTLGAPIAAAGIRGYRRGYDAALNLHLTYELEMIHKSIANISEGSQVYAQEGQGGALEQLSQTLAARLDLTLPTFRSREHVLSMRRTAFSISSASRYALISELGRSWLTSAKLARKAGQWQTAYSAMLQSQQNKASFAFIESAKQIKAAEPLRAVQELENSMRLRGLINDKPGVLDLTHDDIETTKMRAKAQVLRARWMHESERFDVNTIFKIFQHAAELEPTWESCHFYLGQFHDECFKNLPSAEKANRGMKMNLYTVKSFAKAMKYGSKYVYQTVPRLLTIWLDLGEDRTTAGTDVFRKLNDVMSRAVKEVPVYKWYIAFPQIVSRVGHSNPQVYQHLASLIVRVMEEFPKQALWLFISVMKSTKPNREQRGRQLLDQLRSNPRHAGTRIPALVAQCNSMTNELLALCDYPIVDDHKRTLNMSKNFPKLAALGKCELIIPLQESLIATLPSTSSSESVYQPFPLNAPTFEEFFEEIDIMKSLAKPRKITIRGSDGQIYMFLGKPKDDLRKDARLMDFNGIINKLLKANSESRKRQLHIRTYGVVTLNEECGFIQWVPNTIPLRPVLLKLYDARQIRAWSAEMAELFRRIKDAKDKDAAEMFMEKLMPMFPPVFHEWFIETFPEPSAWLASRLSYGRTAAVMSMVGFILGLGDRHGENVLLDTNTGDVVHVDFNCLFEKGKTFETPERVPFRLTQNITDGLGVTGVEGVFRIACEITLQLLRDNKDLLMSILDAFIHDPLVEWEDEKRKLEREPRRNHVKSSVDLRMLAKNALNPIEKKLKGIYLTSKERQEKAMSTSNLVQLLIQDARDPANLAKMYPGWAAWQ